MNTSRAAKEKAETKKEETKVDDLEPLTEKEIEQMNENLPPAKNSPAPAINVSAETLRDDKTLNEVFDSMDKIETSKAQELTSNYIEFGDFEEGEERNYIFTGFTEFVDDNQQVRPAVTLMDKNRKSWVCASIVTVKALQKVSKVPQPVRIRVNGKVKGKNGSYYDTNVFIL